MTAAAVTTSNVGVEPFAIRLRGVGVDYPVRRGERLRALEGVDLDIPVATF